MLPPEKNRIKKRARIILIRALSVLQILFYESDTENAIVPLEIK